MANRYAGRDEQAFGPKMSRKTQMRRPGRLYPHFLDAENFSRHDEKWFTTMAVSLFAL
jgi:hypothetical protein